MFNQLKFTICFFVLFTCNTSQCQYSSIFGDSYTEWNYVTMFCDAIFTTTFKQSDETTIGSTQYKVIDDFGFLRESEDNSKLWYRSSESEEEHLMMDLDLEVGDMFEINSTSYVVDAVYEENGKKIVQFDYEPVNCGLVEPLRFIEGRGPNLSFQHILSGDEYDLGLLRCFTLDSLVTKFFVEQLGEECILNGTSTEELVNNRINVYPNPFDNQFHIEFEESKERTINIFDSLGRNVYSDKSKAVEIEINTLLIKEGFYILQIHDGVQLSSNLIVKKPR